MSVSEKIESLPSPPQRVFTPVFQRIGSWTLASTELILKGN
jgi:hypothetical protein